MKDKWAKDKALLLMCFPAIILIILFNYLPISGIIVAFKDFNISKGIFGSDWNGIENFKFFILSNNAARITKNTLGMNFTFIILGNTVAIAFAVMLYEIDNRPLLKFYQTTYFFPYFLSWVIVGYILYALLNHEMGLINGFLKILGKEPIQWYIEPKYWRVILVLSYLWKSIGYSSVLYYAGMLSIDKQLFEAVTIDGGGFWTKTKAVTLPTLVPLIIILVILAIGRIFYTDFGLFFFLPRDIGLLYPTTDVADTYIYRALRVTGDIGMAAAAGFFQSILGFLLVLTTNTIVRKINSSLSLF